MEKLRYNPDALNELLDEFDRASSHLALVPNLENALEANIASLKWADLLYDIKRNKQDRVPQNLAQRYLLDVNSCIQVLDRLKHRMIYSEKHDEVNTDKKKKRERKDYHHIDWYITQMRARIGLVRELSKEGY